MRKVWVVATLTVALLAIIPAVEGRSSWWPSGIAFGLFVIFLLEPWFLTWEVRKRGEVLQITDEGVLRRLPRGASESVRWNELREVAIVVTQGVNLSDEYFYVLAGTGTTGVLVGQALATKFDLLSHLAKLPGFDHRNIETAMASAVNQKFTLWRAAPLEGEASVITMPRIGGAAPGPQQRLH